MNDINPLPLLALICIFASLGFHYHLLSNFMPFIGKGINLDDCRALYNSRINDCTGLTDFTNNNHCTSGCLLALRNMQARLNHLCRGVTDTRGTLQKAIVMMVRMATRWIHRGYTNHIIICKFGYDNINTLLDLFQLYLPVHTELSHGMARKGT